MRKRYVTRARWCEEVEAETVDIAHAHTIFEPDDSPVFTGILNADGDPIYAMSGIDPIGFVHFEEDEED